MDEKNSLKRGLLANPKYIPMWYRYDKTGSILNEECNKKSPYYYFHKAEKALIKDALKDVQNTYTNLLIWKSRGGIRCHGGVSIPCRPVTPAVIPQSNSNKIGEEEILVSIGTDVSTTSIEQDIITDISLSCSLIDLGSGSSEKTRMILDSILEKQGTLEYLPVDISADFLKETCATLSREYNDRLQIKQCPEDYSVGVKLMRKLKNTIFLIFFGNLQNLPYEDQIKLLTSISKNMKETDYILLSADITQNTDQILKAYLDPTGYCERFGLNCIVRLNKEMKGNIDLDNFSIERDFYSSTNENDISTVRIFLKAKERQIYKIDSLDLDVIFEKGERLNLYEGEGVSHKYTIEQLRYLTKKAHLNIHRMWTNEHVALLMLRRTNTSL